MIKSPPASIGDARDVVLIPRSGRIPWSRKWHPTPVFLPGKFYGQRNLEGYSPWGQKESDMTEATEHAHMYAHMYTHTHTNGVPSQLSFFT